MLERDAREEITLRPIGIIRSPHTEPGDTPIQPAYARGIRGLVEVFPEYVEGLRDLEGFSYIYLLFWFHRAGPTRLAIKPYIDDSEHGVFATRAPCRPNRIGLSLVRLVGVEGNTLRIEDVDILDGTPLLDIKPYVRRFHSRDDARSGWHDAIDEDVARKRGRKPGADPSRP